MYTSQMQLPIAKKIMIVKSSSNSILKFFSYSQRKWIGLPYFLWGLGYCEHTHRPWGKIAERVLYRSVAKRNLKRPELPKLHSIRVIPIRNYDIFAILAQYQLLEYSTFPPENSLSFFRWTIYQLWMPQFQFYQVSTRSVCSL